MSKPNTSTWQRADTLLLAALLAVSSLWIALKVHWSWTPMEDAAMLLRYSQNLAAGHGIRWSLNQPPIDGATDFLYMVLTGALARVTHLSVVTAARWINILSQTATIALLYPAARRLSSHASPTLSRWLAAAVTLYLIAGPFLNLTDACFGTPLFALFLMLCWTTGLHYALQRSTESNVWPTALLMAFFGLLAGLTRPEGVLFALFILAATLYFARHTSRSPLPLILSYLLLFSTLGGAYFLWHWHYFGYPLPNPFYIKGDGHLYLSSVKHSAMNVTTLLLPVLPLIPLGWLSPTTRRLTNALLLVLVPFTLMWILLANTNNHFYRFQYAIVPLVLVTIPALASAAIRLFQPLSSFAEGGGSASPEPPSTLSPLPQRLPHKLAAILAILGAMLYTNHLTTYDYTAWGMRTFALRLAPLAPRGYTMAVTEAGALPLYSRWNTIDALGLNDAYIAHHHRQIDAAYLDRTHPELIMVHIDRSVPSEYLPGGLARKPALSEDAYNSKFLDYYASTHGYTLAAIWGADQCNLHIYWLRQPTPAQTFPDYAAVLSDIRDHPYNFLDDAFLSHDYRNDLPSLVPCAAPEGPPQQ